MLPLFCSVHFVNEIFILLFFIVGGVKKVIENCGALRELNVTNRLYDELNAAIEAGTVKKANPGMSLICSRVADI